MTAKAGNWLGRIAVVLMLLASGTASATSAFLSGNSPLGENCLEGGFRQVSLAISAEACRGCGEGSLQDAAGLFVAPKTGPAQRPTWRQSEKDVGKQLEGQGFEGQKSFLNGKEVPYGTKDSSRPEFYKSGTSIEVKNYDVTTKGGRRNLISNVTKQANERVGNLPSGTVQKIVLDVRGQNVSREVLDTLINDIVAKSNGALKAENITILR